MNKNDFKKIEILLDQVSGIRKKAYEEAEKKGENFNIFKILKLETKEVELHTRLILNLLQPNGKHGLGVKPLKYFIQVISDNQISQNKFLDNIDFKKAHISNKYLGIKSNLNGKSIGGDIDIFIKTEQICFAIENKINASDQNEQLIRYYNSLKIEKIKFLLFYLTLEGKPPSHKSVKDKLKEGENYFLLSYEVHIKSWLELCLKAAAKKPILKETIRQYIISIKRLTGQLTTQQMNEELLDLLLTDYDTSKLINDNFIKAQNKLKNNILEKIFNNLESQNYLLNYDKKKIVLDAPNAPHLWIRKDNWRKGLVAYIEHVKGKSTFELGIVNMGEALDHKERKELISGKNLKSIDWVYSETKSDLNNYRLSNINNLINLSENLTENLIKIANDEKINWIL